MIVFDFLEFSLPFSFGKLFAENDGLLAMESTLFDRLWIVAKFLIVFEFLITPNEALLAHRDTLCRLYFLLEATDSFCRIDFNLELFVRERFELQDKRTWILRLLFRFSSSLASLLILVTMVISGCCGCWYLLSFLLNSLHKLSMLFKLIHNRVFICLAWISI